MNNPVAPKILNDIVDFLQSAKFEISENIEGEGRGGSLKDEGTIKRLLMSNSKFAPYIRDVPPRQLGDMLVQDQDTLLWHPVNIKTTGGAASDNATSKLGFLFALTDITYDELPGSMGWKKFEQLINERKVDNPSKDYWFLCVDKNDTSKVMIRGAKQINCWGENANPGNLLQISWAEEKMLPPKVRSWEEAHDSLVGGIIRCLRKFVNNLPEGWIQ